MDAGRPLFRTKSGNLKQSSRFLLGLGVMLAIVASTIGASSFSAPRIPATRLVLDAKSLHFKNGKEEISFTIRASGGSITGDVKSPAAPFSISSGAGSFSLSDGDTRTVTVRFSPTSKGVQRSKIVISSNADKKPRQSISLSGRDRAAVPTPTLSGAPTPTRTPIRTAAATRTPTPTAIATTIASNWRVLAWNDLGMH